MAAAGKNLQKMVSDHLPVGRLLLIIPIGITAVSFAAIFIRWCEAPALSIAAYRLVLASLVLLASGAKRLRGRWHALSARELRVGVLSGAFLAVHFAAWITSLGLTTVAISVVLVATAPFFVAIGGRIFLHSRVVSLLVFGLVIAFVGIVCIAYEDFTGGRGSFVGDLLALLGAVGGAGYFLCGRYLRRRVDTVGYITLAYTAAAGFLLLFALLMRAPLLGFAPKTYGLLLLIALVPQLIGHSSFNWALRYLSAPLVSTILLAEPVLAGFWAFALLAETPSVLQLFGSVMIIVGVAIAIWSERAPGTSSSQRAVEKRVSRPDAGEMAQGG